LHERKEAVTFNSSTRLNATSREAGLGFMFRNKQNRYGGRRLHQDLPCGECKGYCLLEVNVVEPFGKKRRVKVNATGFRSRDKCCDNRADLFLPVSGWISMPFCRRSKVIRSDQKSQL
jgi:hypothetical protein